MTKKDPWGNDLSGPLLNPRDARAGDLIELMILRERTRPLKAVKSRTKALAQFGNEREFCTRSFRAFDLHPPKDGFAVANVYTTLGELDRFCEQMEAIARKGLPSYHCDVGNRRL